MSNPNFIFEGVNVLKTVREATNDDLVEVAYRLAETDPVLFCRLLGMEQSLVWTNGVAEVFITPKDLKHLRSLRSDDKVRAVKWLRETYAIGLKEAKDLSEWLVTAGYLPHKNWVAGYAPTSLGDILNEQLNTQRY